MNPGPWPPAIADVNGSKAIAATAALLTMTCLSFVMARSLIYRHLPPSFYNNLLINATQRDRFIYLALPERPRPRPRRHRHRRLLTAYCRQSAIRLESGGVLKPE